MYLEHFSREGKYRGRARAHYYCSTCCTWNTFLVKARMALHSARLRTPSCIFEVTSAPTKKLPRGRRRKRPWTWSSKVRCFPSNTPFCGDDELMI